MEWNSGILGFERDGKWASLLSICVFVFVSCGVGSGVRVGYICAD